MSLQEISTLYVELSAVERRLEIWYASLPQDLSFPIHQAGEIEIQVGEGYHKLQLQCRYFEVRELILRPSLYISLYAENAAIVESDLNSITFDDVMRDHLVKESLHNTTQHQVFALRRLRLVLSVGWSESLAPVDGPLFRTHDCFLLALLLIVPYRKNLGSYELAQLMDSSYAAAIDAAEAFLRSSDASGKGNEYAGLLHALREQ